VRLGWIERACEERRARRGECSDLFHPLDIDSDR
jgi:hypothetical protein